jgi:hypothetical protein
MRPLTRVRSGDVVSGVPHEGGLLGNAPKRRAMQLLIRVRGGLVVGYLDGDGLVWAAPGLPRDASATAATALSRVVRRDSAARCAPRCCFCLEGAVPQRRGSGTSTRAVLLSARSGSTKSATPWLPTHAEKQVRRGDALAGRVAVDKPTTSEGKEEGRYGLGGRSARSSQGVDGPR